MSMDFQAFAEHVGLFNKTFKSKNDPNLRACLVMSETNELWEAVIKSKSPEEIEGEWGDIAYVVVGWALVHGINMNQAFHRTALKNQKKIDRSADCVISDSGKVLKPEERETYKVALTKEVTQSVAAFDLNGLNELQARFSERAKEERLREARELRKQQEPD